MKPHSLSCGVWMVLVSLSASSAEPPTAPVLQINAGMHTSKIGRISSDTTGQLVLTCSEDKTARLWQLDNGPGQFSTRLLRVFRPPIGPGKEGMLYCGTLNPQGTIAAVGGWTGIAWDDVACLYLFETATGRMVRRIAPLEGVVMDLSFSASGKFLAATLGAGTGLRIYETATGRELARDERYGNAAAMSVDWLGDHKVITACDDGQLRLYPANSFSGNSRVSPQVTFRVDAGSTPYDVRFSPDGDQVAVAYLTNNSITLHSGQTLKKQHMLLTSADLPGFPATASWIKPSSGDPRVVAGGTCRDATGRHPLTSWRKKQDVWSNFQTAQASTNTILDLSPLALKETTAVLWSSAAPSWGVMDQHPDMKAPDGAPVFQGYLIGESPIFNLAGKHNTSTNEIFDATRISDDGSVIAFRNRDTTLPWVKYSVKARAMEHLAPSETPVGMRPFFLDGLPVQDWVANTSPKLNGQKLGLKPNEISRSLAVTKDNQSFFLGTEWYIRHFRSDGSEIWSIPVPGICWMLNVTADGGMVIASLGDGTIRWYRAGDGKELLAFFPHADAKRWVIWTPKGYYDCSVDGENLIGWHINRAKNQAADFFPAATFRNRFYRPDVVNTILETRDEALALSVANEKSNRKEGEGNPEAIIQQIQPPVVELLTGEKAGKLAIARNADSIEIRYRIRRHTPEPVTRVWVLVNGRPVNVTAPLPTGEDIAAVSVPVPKLDCTVAVMAENRFAASVPSLVKISRIGNTVEADPLPGERPRLFVLSVGISDYSDVSTLPDLHFAAKDGRDFAACFQRQEGIFYQEVTAKILTDSEATAANILDGLDWIKAQTTNKDVCAILIAGHGENDHEGRYYFCPHDYERERRLRTAVSLDDIRRTMAGVPGKVLFFVDTCHAGNAIGRLNQAPDLTRVVNELSSEENGAVLFASSTGTQFSQEHGDWQNGAFTKAVIEGLDGEADLLNTGHITIASLETYISARVKGLTQNSQTPTVAKPQTITDFPIALKK